MIPDELKIQIQDEPELEVKAVLIHLMPLGSKDWLTAKRRKINDD